MKSKEVAIERKKIAMPMTGNEVQQRFDLIQKTMKSRMKDRVHYGTIPGCGDKKTLLKPGSEMLLSMFRIAVEDPKVEDLSTPEEAKFRVTVRGIFAPTGEFVGAGIGSCSSNEEKYKWRAARSQSEFDTTPEPNRRYKYKRRPGYDDQKIMQVRVEPAEVENTVLKMAKKRAQIDMTLTVLAVSDIFTQDMEEEMEDKPLKGKPIVEQPKAKEPEAPKEKVDVSKEVPDSITAKGLLDYARKVNFPIARVKEMAKKCYKKTKSEDLTKKEIMELLTWIKQQVKK